MSCSITFEISTGRLLEYTSPPSTADKIEGVEVLVFNDEVDSSVLYSHYTDGISLLAKPEMRLVFSKESTVNAIWKVSNIPYGTVVKYPDGEIIVDDGFIEWSSAIAGTFTFTFTCFPFKDTVINATITEI